MQPSRFAPVRLAASMRRTPGGVPRDRIARSGPPSPSCAIRRACCTIAAMPATPPVPLFGRDEECERLSAILARDGVALITGEAGIGKTALALAAARASGRRLVHGGGFATLAGIPYLPLQVALGRPVTGDEVGVARQVEAAVRDASPAGRRRAVGRSRRPAPSSRCSRAAWPWS